MSFLVNMGGLSTFINTLSVALMTRRAVALTEKKTIWQRWRGGYPLRPIVEWGIDVDCRVQTTLVRILRHDPVRGPQHPVSRSPNIDYYNELVAAIDWNTWKWREADRFIGIKCSRGAAWPSHETWAAIELTLPRFLLGLAIIGIARLANMRSVSACATS